MPASRGPLPTNWIPSTNPHGNALHIWPAKLPQSATVSCLACERLGIDPEPRPPPDASNLGLCHTSAHIKRTMLPSWTCFTSHTRYAGTIAQMTLKLPHHTLSQVSRNLMNFFRSQRVEIQPPWQYFRHQSPALAPQSMSAAFSLVVQPSKAERHATVPKRRLS